MTGYGHAPYRRLADELAAKITAGDEGYRPGDRLPSIHKLAETNGVSPGTVQKALRILKDAGLVAGEQGWGVTVLERKTAE
jgi:DNA-binding GntR family transcriptional regulator